MASRPLRLWLVAGLLGGGVLHAGAQEALSLRAMEAGASTRPALTFSDLGLRLRAGDDAGAGQASEPSPLQFGVGLGPSGATRGSAQEPLREMSAYATLRSGPSQLQLHVSTPLPRSGGGLGLGLSVLHRF